MVEPREAVETVAFIDHYCAAYEHLFATARSYEAFKFLHLGMISARLYPNSETFS